ncbi:MAG: acetoacetate--CoA ligase, partial [Pseudomonadota bacterium]
MNEAAPLWSPSAESMASGRMREFADIASTKTGRNFDDYESLHAWSCEDGGAFWDLVWDYCEIRGEKGARVVIDEHKMPGAHYFPDAQVNYAENLLRFDDDREAFVFRCEDKLERRVSWKELSDLVSRIQKALRARGVSKGDRIVAMMPNMPEAIAAMMAAVSLGAIWSSCSPDFGEKGVLDRFGQIQPKVFFTCDGYWYAGKRLSILEKLKGIVPQLGCELNIVIPLLGEADTVAEALPDAIDLENLIAGHVATKPEFLRVEPSHPLYIMFSSGTTGIPKCIVHSHGGTLLKILSEQTLHMNIRAGDRVFFFTTCGWMMWNWLATALGTGATLMLYDGSPFAPSNQSIFDYAEQEKFTIFGTSAKFIDAVRNAGLKPIETHDLSSVTMLASTGSPLAPENYEFVYKGIKRDVHLASMSGGTDIMGCFVGGIPWKPVYKGEIQGAVLGMDVQVWDDDGKPMSGKGELVCAHAFPSMPVQFWNDEDGSKYHKAYFDRFKNVWCHGDFAEWTSTGGMVIHGRSDATLNPGGVRIGTAEIYNQVEQMPEVEEALCIGQQWDRDVRVVLFVRLASGLSL